MKKNIVIVIVVLIVAAGVVTGLLLSGAKKEPSVPNGDPKPQAGNSTVKEDPGFVFEYKGVQINMDAPSDKILEALGEPMNYFEAPSCAFMGMDKVYTYSGFDFQTYTENDKDYIASIHFLDDSVTTPEGVGLYSTMEDMIAAYGKDYKQSFSQYTYTKGKCSLSFIIENNEVVSVEYASVKFAEANESTN